MNFGIFEVLSLVALTASRMPCVRALQTRRFFSLSGIRTATRLTEENRRRGAGEDLAAQLFAHLRVAHIDGVTLVGDERRPRQRGKRERARQRPLHPGPGERVHLAERAFGKPWL